MIDKVFDTLIEDIVKELEYTKDKSETLHIIYDAIKKIVPSDAVHILSVDDNNHTAYVIDDENAVIYPLDKGGILSDSYQSHQPLLVNDVTRSLLYNKDVDSLNYDSVAKVLTVPILGYKSSNPILGMIWISLFRGYRQFIQQDIDNLVKFINSIKNRIFVTNTPLVEDSNNHRLLECQEAKRLLKVKVERNESYFASVIHDIRTPMNAVIGFMELMLMGESDEQKKEYINATLKSGEQMVSLINDVLDMSKVSNGQMSINKTDFSPLESFGDIAKLFYNSMIKNSINFNIYIDPLLPLVINSDVYRIKQIVNNLLSNAMKFTPADKDIKLDIRYIDKNIQISVKDTGIGIAEDRQKSIFNPYTQESSSTASQYGGTGLGLAISQQLSTLLNGKLTLNSKQGEGSEFILTIPCEIDEYLPSIDVKKFKDINILFHTPSMVYPQSDLIKKYFHNIGIEFSYWDMGTDIKRGGNNKDILFIKKEFAIKEAQLMQEILDSGIFVFLIEESLDMGECPIKGDFETIYAPVLPNILFDKINLLIDPNERKRRKESQGIENKSLKGLSVLVIDDSRINLKLMVEILKRFDLTIKTAINPKDALEILEDESFDVIFIDQNMPIMQGDEAIAIMRQNEKKSGKKPALIYGVTGDGDEDVIDNIIKAGANKVFTKPIRIAEVYEAISVLKS